MMSFLLFLALLGAGQRSFEFTYEARIVPPAGAQRVEVWLPCPKSDAHQDVVVLSVTSPVPSDTLYDREYGNAIIHIMSGASKSFSVKLRLRVRRREWEALKDGGEVSVGPMEKYLTANRLVTLSPRVKEIAAGVTKGKVAVLDKARALYDYVLNTMTYDKTGTGWGRGDTEYACETKRGNCTDFHSLFIALARALGIPAKFVIGALIPRGTKGTIVGYHCWAEFFLPGRGWVPVDISEAWHHRDKTDYYFGSLDNNRIAFSEGRDIILEPPQNGERLNYFFPPYVEVDGRPWNGATASLSFTK